MGWEIILSLIRPIISIFQVTRESKAKKILKQQVSDITPKSIDDRLKETSEYNRRQIEKSFKDIKIKWHVKFKSIVDINFFQTNCTAMTIYTGDERFWVNLKIHFDDFPEMKIAKKEDKFWVTGIITKVENTSIYIKPLKVEKDKFFLF